MPGGQQNRIGEPWNLSSETGEPSTWNNQLGIRPKAVIVSAFLIHGESFTNASILETIKPGSAMERKEHHKDKLEKQVCNIYSHLPGNASCTPELGQRQEQHFHALPNHFSSTWIQALTNWVQALTKQTQEPTELSQANVVFWPRFARPRPRSNPGR